MLPGSPEAGFELLVALPELLVPGLYLADTILQLVDVSEEDADRRQSEGTH